MNAALFLVNIEGEDAFLLPPRLVEAFPILCDRLDISREPPHELLTERSRCLSSDEPWPCTVALEAERDNPNAIRFVVDAPEGGEWGRWASAVVERVVVDVEPV